MTKVCTVYEICRTGPCIERYGGILRYLNVHCRQHPPIHSCASPRSSPLVHTGRTADLDFGLHVHCGESPFAMARTSLCPSNLFTTSSPLLARRYCSKLVERRDRRRVQRVLAISAPPRPVPPVTPTSALSVAPDTDRSATLIKSLPTRVLSIRNCSTRSRWVTCSCRSAELRLTR